MSKPEKGSKERPKFDIPSILSRVPRPKKALVTGGMPYANGPVHLGHLAGALVPPDIFSRYMGMVIGRENVLFVCGTDDHGSNSEVSARKAGKSTREFIDDVHAKQSSTLEKFNITPDIYSGTSRTEGFEDHKNLCQDFYRKLFQNGMLEKKGSLQWFDPEMNMFLPDRFVQGTCPLCGSPGAYSDECSSCGKQYETTELIDPISTVSSATPVLKETDHLHLNMWKVIDPLKTWIDTKKRNWKKVVFNEVSGTVQISASFSKEFEEKYKELKADLPKHKSRYAPGKTIAMDFSSTEDLEVARDKLQATGIETTLLDGWAHRSMTRDVNWGIPIPSDIDSSLEGKTLYVWPESLIAPISFTRQALAKKGEDPEKYVDYWCDPEAKVYQFLGQDNVFFYVIMQGAMWFGHQDNILETPKEGDLQLTEVFSSLHLQVGGQKMSKSTGNFYTGEQLLEEFGFTSDQIRYYLSILSLAEKESNFDLEDLKRRNEFLAGPLNAAFEKPISACHKKFGGVIPEGKLIGKTEAETIKIVQNYTRSMEKRDFSNLLFAVEKYARIINGLFAQHKPHDDRHPEEERKDALYSCFYILKHLMIMLYPFAPETMEKLRGTLNLPESVFSIDEFGKAMEGGHKIHDQTEYFPPLNENS